MNHRISSRSGQQGTILLAALLAIVVVSALATALFSSADAEMRQSRTHRLNVEVAQLAEAATIAGEQQVMAALANSLPPPTGGTLLLGPNSIPWTSVHVGTDTTIIDPDGIQTTHRKYEISAVATLERQKKSLHRAVDVALTPLFQYAVFFDKDLEILPDAACTLTGRIHSNGDMYLGVADGKTLELDTTYLRCGGSIFHKSKSDGVPTVGKVKTRKMGTSTFYDFESQIQLDGMGVTSISGYDSSFTGFDANSDGDLSDAGDWGDFTVGALTRWAGTVKTGAHGMLRIGAPPIGSISRFEVLGAGQGDYTWDDVKLDYVPVGAGFGEARKGLFHQNADLVLRDLEAFDNAGNAVSLPTGTLKPVSFYDAREGTTVTCTEVDVSKLNASGFFPKNGLIYASRSDTAVGKPNGIRLAHGAELAGPLTVVSEDPVFVMGDYNSTGTRQPAALFADAINLLSNSWDDSKSPGTTPPAASNTTYNMAMVGGLDETAPGQYCGGLDNLPRFHEDWAQSTRCYIKGCFASLWKSQFATGLWAVGGDRYTEPGRIWGYDTNFDTASLLPPFTPYVAQVKNVGWWE